MSTPVFDSVLSDVLHGAHVARARLADARAGIDRLHGPDAHEQCPVCREPWPCVTRRLVDGLSRGDLDRHASEQLVDAAIREDRSDGESADAGRTARALDVLLGRHRD